MPDPSPSPRHMALAAEAVTSGPPHERDLVLRVATAIAAAEERGTPTGDPQHAAAARRIAEDALTDPHLEAISRELRRRDWRPPAGFTCGCNPARGLCPSHTAVRDYEAATVTA